MENTTNETLNRTNGIAHDMKNKMPGADAQLEKMSHDAGRKIGAMASSFADSASEYVKTGKEYVKTSKAYAKENPGKVIAAVAVASLVAGGLLTLAMQRRK